MSEINRESIVTKLLQYDLFDDAGEDKTTLTFIRKRLNWLPKEIDINLFRFVHALSHDAKGRVIREWSDSTLDPEDPLSHVKRLSDILMDALDTEQRPKFIDEAGDYRRQIFREAFGLSRRQYRSWLHAMTTLRELYQNSVTVKEASLDVPYYDLADFIEDDGTIWQRPIYTMERFYVSMMAHTLWAVINHAFKLPLGEFGIDIFEPDKPSGNMSRG